MKSIATSDWFTNLPKSPTKFPFTKKYSEGRYLKVLNYINTIYVGRLSQMPGDFDGYMAVPMTFYRYYNPVEFEIFCIPLERDRIKTIINYEFIHRCWNNGINIPEYREPIIELPESMSDKASFSLDGKHYKVCYRGWVIKRKS